MTIKLQYFKKKRWYKLSFYNILLSILETIPFWQQTLLANQSLTFNKFEGSLSDNMKDERWERWQQSLSYEREFCLIWLRMHVKKRWATMLGLCLTSGHNLLTLTLMYFWYIQCCMHLKANITLIFSQLKELFCTFVNLDCSLSICNYLFVFNLFGNVNFWMCLMIF